jgi:hypothetical protein
MESLYPDGQRRINAWDSGTPPEVAAQRHNELHLPEGVKP